MNKTGIIWLIRKIANDECPIYREDYRCQNNETENTEQYECTECWIDFYDKYKDKLDHMFHDECIETMKRHKMIKTSNKKGDLL